MGEIRPVYWPLDQPFIDLAVIDKYCGGVIGSSVIFTVTANGR